MNPWLRVCAALAVACFGWSVPAAAQQRPLVTEDPETIGAGRILLEGGFDYSRDVVFPLSGLVGNHWAVPTLGVSIGVGSIAEIQVDGGLYQRLDIQSRRIAPFTPFLDVDGDRTSAQSDLVVATKVRMAGETAGRPALGMRIATRLPNVSPESGLGRGTTDFFSSLLIGKTVKSIRVVGNAGLAILGDPTPDLVGPSGHDHLLIFGASVARAVTTGAEVVADVNGRLEFADGLPTPGAESRGMARLGGRYTQGTVRVDGAVLIGFTARDPDIGFTAGFTWVFDAFRVP